MDSGPPAATSASGTLKKRNIARRSGEYDLNSFTVMGAVCDHCSKLRSLEW